MVSFSAKGIHNFLLPPTVTNSDTLTLNTIQTWNSTAVNKIKRSDNRFFKNCIFQSEDLNHLCRNLNRGVLVFTVVFVGRDQSNDQFISLLAYPLQNRSLLDSPEFFVSGDLDKEIKYLNPGWKGKELVILKQDDSQVFDKPSSMYAPNSNEQDFIKWIRDFKTNAALRNYPSEIKIDNAGNTEPFDKMHVFFDIGKLKEIGILNSSSFPEIAFFPIVLFNRGRVGTPEGPDGNYVTLLITPLNASREVQDDYENGLIVSGCTYPKPWGFPYEGVCIDSNSRIQINEII